MKKEVLKNFRNYLLPKDKLKSIKGGYGSEGVCSIAFNGNNGFTTITYWSDSNGGCCNPGAGLALVSNYDSSGNYIGGTYISSSEAAGSHADCA